MPLSNLPASFDVDRGPPTSSRPGNRPHPRLKTIMFQDAPSADVSVRRRITLMSVVLISANLALTLNKNSRVYLFQQARCLIYYQINDSTKIDSDNGVEESLCKVEGVQHPLSILVGMDAMLAILPVLVVLGVYKQLLAQVGLRRLLLVSLFCSAMGVILSTFVFWLRQSWTTPVVLMLNIFDIIGGGDMTRMIMITTCIAEISHPDNLTTTFNYITGTYLLASVGGASFASLLLSHHVYFLNGLSAMCFALTAMLAMLIPSHCGRDSKLAADAVPILSSVEGDESSPVSPKAQDTFLDDQVTNCGNESPQSTRPSSKQHPLQRVLFNSWHASYVSLITLFRTDNPTFTIVLLFFIHGLAINIQVIIPQYTSLVLSWPFAEVDAVIALKHLVSAIVIFCLPVFRKTYLEPHLSTPKIDLLITQASLAANLVGMIGLGFSGVAASTALFIISLCIYTSGIGLADSLTSYGTFSLAPGQTVADFYVRLGLINLVASLTAAPLWSGLFSIVLQSKILPFGLPFWICAGLFGAGLGGVGALRRGWWGSPG